MRVYKLIATLLVSILCFTSVFSQTSKPEEDAVQHTIESFFEGMKTRSTNNIRSVISTNCTLSTVVGNDSTAQTKESKMDDFIKSIESIPSTTDLDERILAYDIKIDAQLAIAWTPYEFYVNDKFSHCGVNVFTLVNTKLNEWKIVSIIDTRRKENCNF